MNCVMIVYNTYIRYEDIIVLKNDCNYILIAFLEQVCIYLTISIQCEQYSIVQSIKRQSNKVKLIVFP